MDYYDQQSNSSGYWSSASSVDSENVFVSRASEIGLSLDEINFIRGKGWATLGTFAFACKYQPGQEDEGPLDPGVCQTNDRRNM